MKILHLSVLLFCLNLNAGYESSVKDHSILSKKKPQKTITTSERSAFFLRVLKDPLFAYDFRQDKFFLTAIEPEDQKLTLSLAKHLILNCPGMIPYLKSENQLDKIGSPNLFSVPIIGEKSYALIRNSFLIYALRSYLPELVKKPVSTLEWGGGYGSLLLTYKEEICFNQYVFAEDSPIHEVAKRITHTQDVEFVEIENLDPSLDFDLFIAIEPTIDMLKRGEEKAKKCTHGIIIVKKDFDPHTLNAFANTINNESIRVKLRRDLPMDIVIWKKVPQINL